MVEHFCDYCQSCPDGYYCSHPSMMYRDKENRKRVRECFFVYMNLEKESYQISPCPFFKGKVAYFPEDEKGYYIGKVVKENSLLTGWEKIDNE